MRSPIPWMGGKKALAKTIVPLLPEHRCYVEPFGGAGWVLFAKKPSKVEVYNDLDARLVTFFRVVKYHPEELCRELEHLVPSRQEWQDLRDQPGLTDVQRAARFYYVLRQSFGGKAGHFGYGRARSTGFLLARVRVDMESVRERTERVTIEHEDFAAVLARYDSVDTCFYLDPPYVDAEPYRVAFGQADHQRLREAVVGLQGAG